MGKKSLLECKFEIFQSFIVPSEEDNDVEVNSLCLLRWFSSPASVVIRELSLKIVNRIWTELELH